MAFEILTADGSIERVDGADSYELEGPLTTFFAVDGAHARLSAWSVRMASIRTDHIVSVRRVEDAPGIQCVEDAATVELRAAS